MKIKTLAVSIWLFLGSATALGSTEFVEISAGTYHTCAIDNSRSLWCWGRNFFGQLGLGYTSNEPKNIPQKVTALSNVKSVSIGSSHTCAIDLSDDLWCWGWNVAGQLGLGYGEKGRLKGDQSTPKKITGISRDDLISVKSVSAGAIHTCAIDLLDNLWCWGSNVVGQVGYGHGRGVHHLPFKVTSSHPGS